jgi:hypothetical protein
MHVPSWALWLEMMMRVVWLLSATGVALSMRRLGHDAATWGLVGLVGGPVAIPMAFVAARRAARRPPRLLFAGTPGKGDEDVLVLLDPDQGGDVAHQLGPTRTIGRLVLAVVIGRTTADVAARKAEERRAADTLSSARKAVHAATGIDPGGIVLEGRTARVGPAYARRFGFGRIIGLGRPPGTATVSRARAVR